MNMQVTLQVAGVDKLKDALGEYLMKKQSFVLDLHRTQPVYHPPAWLEPVEELQERNNESIRDYFRVRNFEPLPTDAQCQALLCVYADTIATGAKAAFSDLLDGIIYGGKGPYETKSILHLLDSD